MRSSAQRCGSRGRPESSATTHAGVYSSRQIDDMPFSTVNDSTQIVSQAPLPVSVRTVLVPRASRYLIDLNRPPDGSILYAGANNTEQTTLPTGMQVGLGARAVARMIGEIAPMNAGTLMDPRPFLDLPEVVERPVTAWLWKRSDTDLDALLGSGTTWDVG